MERPRQHANLVGDVLCALALAAVLTFGWAARDWAQISALRLPDTDDVMRLQQIRDWLGGQAFADLMQHRLGASPGLAMHWSRLPDLVPAALIAALTPLVGTHDAELTAVILWPALLFTVALALTGRIARAVGGAEIARTAIVVAAIAYPATSIFMPGRIDHHGLQLVLLLVIARTIVAPPTIGQGLAAGFAAAASLVVGLETAPLIAAAGLVMAAEWLTARGGANDRMMGFGIATGAGLLAASIFFKTAAWGYPACDGFTATAWKAGILAAFAPMLLALGSREETRPVIRLALATSLGLVLGASLVIAVPKCLSPYGDVDPLLARLWLAQVGEAQSLFAAPAATAFGYAGIMLAGVAAGASQFYRTRDERWAALLALQIAALLLTLVQLRGAYAGAILAAPALAALIAAARRRGALSLAVAWAASAGMLYPIAAHALVPHPAVPAASAGDCTSPAALARIAALPPGRLIAPLDLGAFALAASRHSVVGAPYHRGNAGNAAVYHFFLSNPRHAAAIAASWEVRYVALCADSFGDLDRRPWLATGLRPAWLRPIGAAQDGLLLYRVEPDLFPPRASR